MDVVPASLTISWPLVTSGDGTDKVALNLINVRIVEKNLKIHIPLTDDYPVENENKNAV